MKITINSLVLKLFVLFSFLATIVVNALSNVLPIGGNTTQEVANKYPVYFFPAAYVFAIWGLIYLGLTAFIIFYFIRSGKYKALYRKIAPWFILSCIANSVWLVLWHTENLFLSVLVILVLLVSLIKIYFEIDKQKANLTSISSLTIKAPFSIYLAWSCVATIANIAGFLFSSGWQNGGLGISAISWTVIMLIVATVLTSYFVLIKKDIAFGFVIIWAFVGIFVRYPQVYELSVSVMILVGIIIGMIIASVYKKIFRIDNIS
jgi:hypothetical protein